MIKIMIYKLMELLEKETTCQRMKEKSWKKANGKARKISPKKECKYCQYGRFLKSDSVLSSGFVCRLNPLEPIALGLEAKHEDRDRMIEKTEIIRRAYMSSNGKVLQLSEE